MSSWPNHLQSPGVPSHTQVREPQSAMRHQEQPPVQGLWSPRSAMEVMNQSGQPRKSGKRRPMWPAPLTSGGLTLEEITCRGWGPHLQYSFLIKLGKYCKEGRDANPQPQERNSTVTSVELTHPNACARAVAHPYIPAPGPLR